MNRHHGLSPLPGFGLLMLLLLSACKDPDSTEQAAKARPKGETVPVVGALADQSKIAALKLTDLQGQPADAFESGVISQATVFLFLRTDCPIGNRYAPEITRLHDEFLPRGIAFNLIYPDGAESPEMIRQHLADYALPPCRVLSDPAHELVALTGVSITPEVAVYDAALRLVYRGRIDNRFVDFGKTRLAPSSHELRDALEAILAGRPVRTPTREAIGCPIPGG